MNRLAALSYGLLAYVVFLGTFLYAIGFVADVAVPRSIDSGPESVPGSAFAIDLALLALFALQHSVMARPAFKRAWTRIVPEPIERSTYVLLSSLCLCLLFWQWRPLPALVWDVGGSAGKVILWSAYGLGWGLLLVSTFLIDHFDLFGLRQVVLYFLRRPCTPLDFQSRLFYRVVRHPLMVSWIVIFWCTPRMTAGHLLFAATTTLYILVAIQLEERDLMRLHGRTYADYRKRVPMLVPFLRRSPRPGSQGDPSLASRGES